MHETIKKPDEDKITISIVIFFKNKTDEKDKLLILNNLIDYYSNEALVSKIIIIDNSENPTYEEENFNSKVQYKHMRGLNLGYGKGHNLAKKLIKDTKYHLISNPDIVIKNKLTLTKLYEYMQINNEVSLIQPLILSYPSGAIQKLCKRNPTLLAQILRGFCPNYIKRIFRNYLDWYEMIDKAYSNKIVESEYLSGSFMFCRKESLDKVGWFNKNYFMYLEDADLTRELSKIGKCIHFPQCSIYHVWERGSHKRLNLKFIAIKSFLIYSLKWGLSLY